jgi:arginine-tRNA-protein transferase
MNNEKFKLGLTTTFDCSYLNKEQEQLLIALDDRLHNNKSYTWLMEQGFRRSGEQIYRPHCPSCKKCESIRVLVDQFSLSKSQKRLIKRTANFKVHNSSEIKPIYYPLYEQYINTIHREGSMFPATLKEYSSFLTNDITEQLFIETWHEDKLISVAVTDCLENGLSAVYTFYHPDYRRFGLGILSILNQIKLTQEFNKPFLYLGYQIDDCQKMNYKNRYFPHQRLVGNSWLIVNKSR